LPTFAVVSRPG